MNNNYLLSAQRFLARTKTDTDYRRKTLLVGLLVVVSGIILLVNGKNLLTVFLVGTGEDKNSIQITKELFFIFRSGWNPVLLGILLGGGLLFVFGFARKDLARIGLKGAMNGIVYLGIVSYFVERVKPIFFTVPLFFMLLVRIGILLKQNRGQFMELLKRSFVPIVFFVLIFLLHIFGIVQVITGTADDVRNTIPVFEQAIVITPYFHAFVYFMVLVVNEWEILEYEKYIKIIVFLGIFLFIESLFALYFGAESLVNVSLDKHLGMFSGAFLGGYHKMGRLAMVIGFMALYLKSRTQKNVYWALFVMAVLVNFSALNRSAIGAFFLGLGMIVFQQMWSRLLKMEKKHKRVVIYSSIVFFLLVGVSLLWFASIVRDLSPYLEMGPQQLLDTSTDRIKIIARSIDVLINKLWIGTGPLNATYYFSSETVPAITFEKLYSWLGGGFPNVDEWIQFEFSTFFASRTAHNLWMNIVLEWGVIGFAIIGYVLYRGVLWLQMLWRSIRSGESAVEPLWILWVCLFSVGLSLLFTIKFRYYSLFTIILLFTGTAIREFDSIRNNQNEF